MVIDLTDEERTFLVSILSDVIPTLQASIKDAFIISAQSDAILEKLKFQTNIEDVMEVEVENKNLE